jgi:hypothetical protein
MDLMGMEWSDFAKSRGSLDRGFSGRQSTGARFSNDFHLISPL